MTIENLFTELEPPEESTSVGTYRCRDNISNLRLRVKIRPVSSKLPSVLSLSSSSEETGDSSPEKDVKTRPSIREEVTLSWQQKVFSKAEFRQFANAKEDDFESPLNKKLVCDAKKLMTDGFVPKNKISTKVEGEEEDEELDIFTPMTNNPNEEPNFVSILMREGVRRRGVTRVSSAGSGHVATRNVVTTEPTREMQLRNHVVTTPIETMEIRVDINTEDGGSEHSVVLCTLTYSGTGVLTVKPDFNWSGIAYRLEVEGREVLEYLVEHASPDMDYDTMIKEAVLQNEVYARHNQLQQSEVGDNFEMPPAGMFRLHVCGEIVSARMFDYDCLYVNYMLDLPPGWTAGEDTRLQGITQRCYTTANDNGEDVAHFSFPVEADLFFSINSLDTDKEVLPRWPQLLVEVVSVDTWSRYRVEGYGHTVLPSHPGHHSLVIDTWRPVVSKTYAEMKRFFIGGTPELEDIRYVGNTDTKAGVISKMGFQTQASGKVMVRMNIIHQAKAFMLGQTRSGAGQARGHGKQSRRVLLDRLSSATLFTSVNTVLEAFRYIVSLLNHRPQFDYSSGKLERKLSKLLKVWKKIMIASLRKKIGKL